MTDLTLTPEQRAEAIEALAGVFLAHGVAVDFDGEAYIERPNLVAERALDALLPLLSGFRPEPVAGVRVRPLVWVAKGPEHDPTYVAETACGRYAWWHGYFTHPKSVTSTRSANPKADAEAHYEAAILSALEPVALPDARAAAAPPQAEREYDVTDEGCARMREMVRATMEAEEWVSIDAAPPPDAIAAAEARGMRKAFDIAIREVEAVQVWPRAAEVVARRIKHRALRALSSTPAQEVDRHG